jgi:hypothetical protein
MESGNGARMNREVQALADALAGNVRLRFSDEKWTASHVRNVLLQAGVPIIWKRDPLRVNYGRLRISNDRETFEYEVLWEPEVRQPLDLDQALRKIKGCA